MMDEKTLRKDFEECPDCVAANTNNSPICDAARQRIEPFTGFRTTDGNIYKSEQLALRNQLRLDFIEWYSQNEIDCDWREPPTAEAVFDWLREHQQRLTELFQLSMRSSPHATIQEE